METLLNTLIVARKTLAEVQKFLRKYPEATKSPIFTPSLLNKVSYLRTTLGRFEGFEKRKVKRQKSKKAITTDS